MRVIAVAKTVDDRLTPEQRIRKIGQKLDDIKKPPSLLTKAKRFMTDPIIWPKHGG